MCRLLVFMLGCGLALVSNAAPPTTQSCIWARCPDLKTDPWHTGIKVAISEKRYFGADTLSFLLGVASQGSLSRCTPEGTNSYKEVADGRAGDYVDLRMLRDQAQLASVRLYKSVYGIVRVVDEQVLRAKQMGVYKDNCFFGAVEVGGRLERKANTQVVASVEKIDFAKDRSRVRQQFLDAWNVLLQKSKTSFQAELLFLPYSGEGESRIDWVCGSTRGAEKVSALHIHFSIPNPAGVPIRVPVLELDYVKPVAISRGTFHLGWGIQHRKGLDSLKVKMHYTCTSNKKVRNRTYAVILPGLTQFDGD